MAYTVAADAALAAGPGSPETDRSACHWRVGHALLLLTLPEHFDAAMAQTRALLGPVPEGRLMAAWQMVDEALQTTATTRHEWVGADPGTVAAGGWVLVDRMARLLTGAALVGQAAERTRAAAQAAEPGRPAATAAELLVNAARRYGWTHLRGPAPEAATPVHLRRSAELAAALAPTARRGYAQ